MENINQLHFTPKTQTLPTYAFVHEQFDFHVLSFFKIILQWRSYWDTFLREEPKTIKLSKKHFLINMGALLQKEAELPSWPPPPFLWSYFFFL